MTNKKIKVLIIDDSMVIRRGVAKILEAEDDIQVVGSAKDPFEGRDKIVKLAPDVIILDIEMPRMDGLTFLEKLMRAKPMPVIIFSSLARERSKYEIKAFDLGAVDVLEKPTNKNRIPEISEELKDRVRKAGSLNRVQIGSLKRRLKNHTPSVGQRIQKNILLEKPIIAIGASTGGTHAIKKIVEKLPAKFPPVVMVQHMPKNFTTQFAKRLNDVSQLTIKEANGNEVLKNGVAYLAPGGMHMEVIKKGAYFYTKIVDGPLIYHQKPSVEILFESVAKHIKSQAIGIILTGMGADGAKGLLTMKQKGAYTIAQSEKSCTVFGMPKEAIRLNAVDKIVDLEGIPNFLIQYLERIS